MVREREPESLDLLRFRLRGALLLFHVWGGKVNSSQLGANSQSPIANVFSLASSERYNALSRRCDRIVRGPSRAKSRSG